jgi:hypothetical protein
LKTKKRKMFLKGSRIKGVLNTLVVTWHFAAAAVAVWTTHVWSTFVREFNVIVRRTTLKKRRGNPEFLPLL